MGIKLINYDDIDEAIHDLIAEYKSWDTNQLIDLIKHERGKHKETEEEVRKSFLKSAAIHSILQDRDVPSDSY